MTSHEHDSIRWYIEALKKDRRNLSPEDRLRLAAEFIDAIIEMRLKMIMKQYKCSRKEAIKILRKLMWEK